MPSKAMFVDCSAEEQIERWERVERVLTELTPHERRKHFDMRGWARKTPCGTVACAAGHCGMDPWFRRRGFHISPNGDFKGMDVTAFFGYHGTNHIFLNATKRPVSDVIKEVRAYVKQLKGVV